MNFSIRTIGSIAQFLVMLGYSEGVALLIKHGYQEKHSGTLGDSFGYMPELIDLLKNANHDVLFSLIDEIGKTHAALRIERYPFIEFDARWNDLLGSLRLDGFLVDQDGIRSIEPILPAWIIVEDDLTKLLKEAKLSSSSEVLTFIEESSRAFIMEPSDYNGCLSKIRIALETLARDMSGSTSWGVSLTELKSNGLITDRQEKGLAGVYTFISDGAHMPIGLTEKEMARLGRSLGLNMCYFLVKIYLNGINSKLKHTWNKRSN